MIYQGRDSVIHIDDILAAAHSGLDYPIELEHDLLACVRQGNRQSSVEIIGRLADHLLVQPQESPEVVRTRLTELVALISRAIIAAGASSSQTLEVSHRQITALASLHTPEEIREWAAASVSDLVSGIRPPDSGDTAVDRATRYVREKHRRPDLNLEEVANNVHLSPSHLARLFKAKMGVSYVKYLTSVRMEDAKRLLRTTEMTVGAVATAVGYEDSPYFHRVFRRETGMTPANYRHVTRVKSQSEQHAVRPSNVRKE
jgi:two-component system, response regulator YesN